MCRNFHPANPDVAKPGNQGIMFDSSEEGPTKGASKSPGFQKAKFIV